MILRGCFVSLRDLVISVLSLAIGLPLGGTDLLLFLNGALDTSPPVAHETRAITLRRTTGKNSVYHVMFGSWRPGEKEIELSIGSNLFWKLKLAKNEAVTVTTRRGFLGWERLIGIVRSTTTPQ